MERPAKISHPLIVLIAVGFSLPILWMVLSSFKPPGQPENEFWPRSWYWENYRAVISETNYVRFLWNSILLSVLNVAGTLVSCTLVAYGFSRLKWPGRDFLFFVLITTMLLPFHVTMLPRFKLFSALGMYNTYWPLVLPSWLAGEAFYVFLLRQFFLTIPEDLSEAARLDGASELKILTKIVIPLSWPALATVALFQFLNVWNEFAAPLLYLNDPHKFPLAYALQQFVSAYRTEFGPLMAASVLFTLPVIVLFFLAQKTFIRGVATSGLKG